MAWGIPQLNYSNALIDPNDIASIGTAFAAARDKRKKDQDDKEAGALLSRWGDSQYDNSTADFGQSSSVDPINSRIDQAFSDAGIPPRGGNYAGALGVDAAPAAYRSAYANAGERYGVDPTMLVKQGAQESGFNPNAVSPAGARGISQFMPQTAERFGIDPSDPNQSIDAQGRYMAANSKMFGGNQGLALAAYNWGEGNVHKWVAAGADPRRMPAETRGYIQKITGKPIEQWLADAGGANGGAQPVSSSAAQPSGLPDRALLADMLRNPVTRSIGLGIVKDYREGRKQNYDYQRVGNDLVRIDKNTGNVEPLFRGQSSTRAGNPEDTGNAQSIAQAIVNGDQPPVLTGLYRLGGPVRAELERQGYDLTRATQDWTATTKLLATMNGAQQTRLRQAVGQVKEALPLVQELADKWGAGGYPVLNKAELEIAKQGGLGPDAQSLAVQLEAEIADITSELGTVYKGGNSSTDESLKLAATQLKANWSNQTLKDAIKLAQKNITYRENSLRLGTAGIENSQYNQMQPTQEIAPRDDGSDVPDGVDPEDWKYMSPEDRQEYLSGQ